MKELLLEFIWLRYGDEYTCDGDLLLIYHKVVILRNDDVSPADKVLIGKTIRTIVLEEETVDALGIIIALEKGIEEMKAVQADIMDGRDWPPEAA